MSAGGIAALACNKEGLLASSCHSGTLSLILTSKGMAAAKETSMRLLPPKPNIGTLRLKQQDVLTVSAPRYASAMVHTHCHQDDLNPHHTHRPRHERAMVEGSAVHAATTGAVQMLLHVCYDAKLTFCFRL